MRNKAIFAFFLYATSLVATLNAHALEYCSTSCDYYWQSDQESVWRVLPRLTPLRDALREPLFDINGQILIDASDPELAIEFFGNGRPDVGSELAIVSEITDVTYDENSDCQKNAALVHQLLGLAGSTVFPPDGSPLISLLLAYLAVGGGEFNLISETPYIAEGTGNRGVALAILGLLRAEIQGTGLPLPDTQVNPEEFKRTPGLDPGEDLDFDGASNECEYRQAWPSPCLDSFSSSTFPWALNDPFDVPQACNILALDEQFVQLPPSNAHPGAREGDIVLLRASRDRRGGPPAYSIYLGLASHEAFQPKVLLHAPELGNPPLLYPQIGIGPMRQRNIGAGFMATLLRGAAYIYTEALAETADGSYEIISRDVPAACPLDGIPTGPGYRATVPLSGEGVVSVLLFPEEKRVMGVVLEGDCDVSGIGLLVGGGAGTSADYVGCALELLSSSLSFDGHLQPGQADRLLNTSATLRVAQGGDCGVVDYPLQWLPLPEGGDCGVTLPYLPDGEPEPEGEFPEAITVAPPDYYIRLLIEDSDDANGNGICDLEEYRCFGDLLASGDYPEIVRAFLINRALVNQDLAWIISPETASLADYVAMVATIGNVEQLCNIVTSDFGLGQAYLNAVLRYDFSMASLSKDLLRDCENQDCVPRSRFSRYYRQFRGAAALLAAAEIPSLPKSSLNYLDFDGDTYCDVRELDGLAAILANPAQRELLEVFNANREIACVLLGNAVLARVPDLDALVVAWLMLGKTAFTAAYLHDRLGIEVNPTDFGLTMQGEICARIKLLGGVPTCQRTNFPEPFFEGEFTPEPCPELESLTVDLSEIYRQFAAAANGGSTSINYDLDNDGLCDLEELEALGNLLASGSDPLAVQAFVQNGADMRQVLSRELLFREMPQAHELFGAWVTLGKTEYLRRLLGNPLFPGCLANFDEIAWDTSQAARLASLLAANAQGTCAEYTPIALPEEPGSGPIRLNISTIDYKFDLFDQYRCNTGSTDLDVNGLCDSFELQCLARALPNEIFDPILEANRQVVIEALGPGILAMDPELDAFITLGIALGKPSPVPFPISLVVKNGSKIRVAVSLSMPQPVSLMATQT